MLSPGGPIPHNHGEGFDAPPTLERSGSEHRRAVTSLALLERARAWEWVKDPLFARGDRGVEQNLRYEHRRKKADKEAESFCVL